MLTAIILAALIPMTEKLILFISAVPIWMGSITQDQFNHLLN